MTAQRPEGTASPQRRLDRRVVGVVVGVLVVLAVVFALTRGGSDPTPTPVGGSEPSVSNTTSTSAPAPLGSTTTSASTATPSGGAAASSSSSDAATATAGATSSTPAAGGASPTTFPGGATPRPTAPPVSLTAPATPVAGVTARLARIEKVQGVSTLPGEIAGPSLRVTVEYDNQTNAAVDLRGAVVNLYAGRDLAPAIMLTQPGAKAFPASVAAGATAQGVFVFNVPNALRSQVRVEADLANAGEVVLFQGPAS